MDAATRERLRIAISVTLSLVPRPLRRNWAERIIAKCAPAQAEIVARIVAELDGHFEIEAKPSQPAGPGPHTAWTGGKGEPGG